MSFPKIVNQIGFFGEKRKKMFFRFCRPTLDIFGFPLLITCIKTASFWQTFQVWWYGKTSENRLLNQGKILYGFFENTAHWQALNYLIILAKYHIFCTNGTNGIIIIIILKFIMRKFHKMFKCALQD